MKRVKLNILGLSYSQTQSGAYALVLSEAEGSRRIPIIIGAVEAQAIAIQLEGLKPPRPLTHDLFLNTAVAFNIDIVEVFINKLEEGIFYAEMICQQNETRITIDSRTSDAIALALRFECPVYTTEAIIEKAGIVLDFEEEPEIGNENIIPQSDILSPEDKDEENYTSLSVEELNAMLKDAIAEENYEKASEIRDEIKRRS